MIVTLLIFLVVVGGAFLLGTRFPSTGIRARVCILRDRIGTAEETIHNCTVLAMEDADRCMLAEQILYQTRLYHVNGREITE